MQRALQVALALDGAMTSNEDFDRRAAGVRRGLQPVWLVAVRLLLVRLLQADVPWIMPPDGCDRGRGEGGGGGGGGRAKGGGAAARTLLWLGWLVEVTAWLSALRVKENMDVCGTHAGRRPATTKSKNM
jgi:hypothetical protein